MTSNTSDRIILILLVLILLVPLVLTLLFATDQHPSEPTVAPTLTAVNISPSPTAEWACRLIKEAGLYRDHALTELIVLLPKWTNVLLTPDSDDVSVWVVTASGIPFSGYLSKEALDDGCQ